MRTAWCGAGSGDQAGDGAWKPQWGEMRGMEGLGMELGEGTGTQGTQEAAVAPKVSRGRESSGAARGWGAASKARLAWSGLPGLPGGEQMSHTLLAQAAVGEGWCPPAAPTVLERLCGCRPGPAGHELPGNTLSAPLTRTAQVSPASPHCDSEWCHWGATEGTRLWSSSLPSAG